MPQSRIKGITIEIGANTIKLTEAIRKVDDNLKDTQADLRDVNKLLKLDPGNVQLLAQKQELLKKATEDTAEKLRIEKEALEQLKASPDADKTIEQQQRLEREIIATEAQLKKYQQGVDETTSSLKASESQTNELTKSMKETDESLSKTKQSLKEVDKALKLDPKNVDLLKQKQELLKKATEDTAEKLRIEKEALEQLKASPDADKTIEQQRKLEREIASTTAELKNYQKELKGIPASLDAVGQKTDELANKTAALSAASAAALAGMGKLAYDAGKTADDLNTLSKQTGFSTAELQKMQYASDLVDVSMEDMTGSLQKMVKQMGAGSEAFKTLGVAITDENGELRNATEVWYETIEALSQIQNETERDTLAMDIFGKSAASLAGIVDDGGEALRKYGKDAENLGLIMSQDTLDAANQLNDAIDLTKARLEATFLETGAKVAETVLPIVEDMADDVANLFEWISQLDEGTLKTIAAFLTFGAVISPVLKLVSTGITLFNGATTALGIISGTAIPGVAASAATASTGIIASLGAILPWVAAAVAAIVSLIAVYEQLKKEKAEAQGVQAKQDLQNQGYKYVSQEDLQYYSGGPAKSLWNGSGWDYYVDQNAKYDWGAKQEAQSVTNYNMTNNIARVDDLQDLLDMADQAQLLERMGVK